MPNERLRDAMLKNGLAPSDVAARLGVNPKSVERWITLDRPPYPRHRHALAALLRESESYLWPSALPPERAVRVAQSEVVHMYPRRSAVPSDLWGRLLDQASERISILVYAGLFFPEQDPKLPKVFKKKAAARCRVEILLGDPDCDAVALRGAEERVGDAMAAKIRNVLALYDELRGVEGVQLRFHDTALYNSIYRFDDEMLVNTHVYGVTAPHAPVLHLRRLSGGDLFDTYANSFDRVWSTSRAIWSSDVAA